MPYSWPKSCTFPALAAYWSAELGIQIAPHTCACCARVGPKIERAHLTAHKLGGKCRPENAMPLCKRCHANSEGQPAEAVIEWVRATRSTGTLVAPSWCCPKTPLEVAEKELLEAHLAKMQAETSVEYSQAIVNYNEQRIFRLYKRIQELQDFGHE